MSSDLFAITACQLQFLEPDLQRHKDNPGNNHHSSAFHWPRARQRYTSCCVGEYVYLFCGKGRSVHRNNVWKFHILQQSWEIVEIKGSYLPILQGHTSVVHEELILIFGGTFSSGLGDSQFWTFNTDLDHLQDVLIKPGKAQPTYRRDHSAIVHNSVMYIYGGFVDSQGANDELWAFHIDGLLWTQLTTQSHVRPDCRYGHSAVVAENAMWLFGGMAGLNPRSDLWRYSFLLHQWKRVKGLGSPPCLSGHTASVIYHSMVVIGGRCQGIATGDVWCYSFGGNSWVLLTGSNVVLPSLSFHTCVVYYPTSSEAKELKSHPLSKPNLKVPPKCQPYTGNLLKRPLSSHLIKEKIPGLRSQNGKLINSRIEARNMTFTDCIGNNMSMTAFSENDLSDNTDSCSDIEDTRIHVNLEEALIPCSPATLSPHSRLVTVLRKESRYSKLEEDANIPHPFEKASQDLCQQLPGTFDGSPESVSDLINLFDSPISKITPCLKSANTKMQNPLKWYQPVKCYQDQEWCEMIELQPLSSCSVAAKGSPVSQSAFHSYPKKACEPAAGTPKGLNLKTPVNGNAESHLYQISETKQQSSASPPALPQQQSLCLAHQINDKQSSPKNGAYHAKKETLVENKDFLVQTQSELNARLKFSFRPATDIQANPLCPVTSFSLSKNDCTIPDIEGESGLVTTKNGINGMHGISIPKKGQCKTKDWASNKGEKYVGKNSLHNAKKNTALMEPFVLVLGGLTDATATDSLAMIKVVFK